MLGQDPFVDYTHFLYMSCLVFTGCCSSMASFFDTEGDLSLVNGAFGLRSSLRASACCSYSERI